MIRPDIHPTIGRGLQEGARLFRVWFESLTEAAERGEKAAYVFVMGSLTELLRVFDFHVVFPEINSLQTAIRRVSHDYLATAEDYGYSPDICGYVKADVAVQLRGGRHAMGRIPKPSIAVLTNACNTYVKWAEIWERFHGTPVFVLDVPGRRHASQASEGDASRDLAYVVGQIRELVALCERVSGRRFDIDRLRRTLADANGMAENYRKVMAANRARPAPYNALTDGTVFLGVANAFRGTPEGKAYFADLAEEMDRKVSHGVGTIEEEAYRLAVAGVPCYPIYRRFNEMFSHWRGNFVYSTYMRFASGGLNVDFAYDTAHPLESLAEGILRAVRDAMDSMFYPERSLEAALDPYGIDGVVFHPVKSCRTTSTGMADARRGLMERRPLPSLLLESDMMDRRVVSEAQMKNRVDAFFEALKARRAASAAAGERR